VKPCNEPGCPELIEGVAAYCPKHKKRVGGSRWVKLQKLKLRTDPICEVCMRRFATEVDHVVEIQDGGSEFDWDNLQSICSECHKVKSAERRRVRE
jgi:5-methylcytosine-specific restriction protein A